MDFTNFKSFIESVTNLVWLAIPVVLALILLVYVWGITKFIGKAGDSKSHSEGKNLLVWGTVALFVTFSLWGILRFLHTETAFEGAPSQGGDFGLPLFQHR